ncbi:TIGR01777 family oxidoreductase [Microbulbifer sp. ZKSA002]|uniref:TIGR01777 family oxidoreductase n=1 Tax=Microbulbifer sp. ZKSA002 TaxID=3243388 RepID=UPI00403A73C1
MHCLISGGTGLIGRLFCRRWLERGNTITVLSRHPDRVRNLCGESAKACRDPAEVNQPVDVIVNLAGAPISRRWTEKYRTEIRSSRLDTTEKLVRWTLGQRDKPSYFLSGSAIGYYGNRGGELLKEDSAPGGGFAAQLCRDWEAATLPLQHSGVKVGIIRTAIVLSMRGGALPQMLPPFRLGLGGPMGSGEHWMSWIHEEDEVGLLLHAIDNQLCRPFNGSAPEPVTNNSFARILAKELHRPAFLRLPAWALKIAFGEMADELLLASDRVEPCTALETGYTFQFPTLEQALSDLLKGDGATTKASA